MGKLPGSYVFLNVLICWGSPLRHKNAIAQTHVSSQANEMRQRYIAAEFGIDRQARYPFYLSEIGRRNRVDVHLNGFRKVVSQTAGHAEDIPDQNALEHGLLCSGGRECLVSLIIVLVQRQPTLQAIMERMFPDPKRVVMKPHVFKLQGIGAAIQIEGFQSQSQKLIQHIGSGFQTHQSWLFSQDFVLNQGIGVVILIPVQMMMKKQVLRMFAQAGNYRTSERRQQTAGKRLLEMYPQIPQLPGGRVWIRHSLKY